MKAATSFRKSAARTALCAGVIVAMGMGLATAGNETMKPAGAAAAQKTTTVAPQLKPQTTCPIMGNEIDKSLYVDYNGKRIYVCCNACIDPVKKDPEKYIKKLEALGQSVETVPGKKAVSGDTPKIAAKDTAVKMAKCPMMGDSSKKNCAMAGDTCKKKCPMMNDTSKVKGCYTCPMHADVMKKEPGKCPKCGMDLTFQKCVWDTSKANGRGGCCRMRK